MLIGILGDVHSNIEALDAVIAAARADGVEHWVQVGDVVGYGADPVACIDRIRELGCVVCQGNHDAAVVESISVEYFNLYARVAIDWTREQLDSERLDFLRGLTLEVDDHPDYQLVHGSLHMPEQFGYVLSKVEAIESLVKQTKRACFVGHSHVPALYRQPERGGPQEVQGVYGSTLDVTVAATDKVLLNVGSVGQPRDEDNRAAYALYETEELRFTVKRVEYDVETAQRKIREAGLPGMLADRLALGL